MSKRDRRSKRSPSPMEQGELDEEESPVDLTSPELRLEADDSHFSAEEDDDRRRSSEEDEENRNESPDRSEDDTLDIKPPQQTTGKRDKHKKKHKDERRRDREQNSKESDRSKHSGKEEKERSRERRDRGDRDEFREKEERRRLKSLKESGASSSFNTRERLERLERQRHRIDRDRQKREHEHREQLRKQEREKREREKERLERAEKERRKEEEKRWRERQKPVETERPARRDKDKPRRDEPRGDERIVQRSRSPHDRERRDNKDRERFREREKDRDVRDRHEERQRRGRREESPVREARNGASGKDRGNQRRVEYGREEEEAAHEEPRHHEHEEDEEYQDEQTPSDAADTPRSPAAASDVASASPPSAESRSESEDTESDSASDTDQDPRGGEGERENTPDYKRRSKFDDPESEKESETESVHHSEENEEEYLDETPPASPVELKPLLPPYLPAIQGCRAVDEFQCLNRIEEGTYGVVYRAVDKKSNEVVALKKLKMEKEKEGFPITSLREINTLLKAQHVNIVTVREIVVGSNMDKIFIVMDYVEHDLKSLMETMKEPFIIGEVKTLMIQLLRGVAHLHDNWIVHRDLKTSNLLLSHKGILKIGDFGLAREYGSPLKQYTPVVVTLWYRAPELLLGTKLYSTHIDMWSCGCIFAEFLTRKPLFPGRSDIDQLNKIFKDLGTPNEKIWTGVSELPAMKKCTFADQPYNQIRNRFGTIITEKGFDLMNRFLTYNPEKRIPAESALKHEYFAESPLPVDPSMFPTWPAKSEQPRRTHGNSPKPPSGGKAYAKLLGDDDHVAQSSGGFHLATATKGASAAGAGFALKF